MVIETGDYEMERLIEEQKQQLALARKAADSVLEILENSEAASGTA